MNILDGGTVSNAERIRWQHRAAAELAAVLEGGEGLTPISWTISPLGLMLTGRVNGLVPADQVRAVFDQWRRLLRLDDVLETRASDVVTHLRARAQRGGVRVAVTASVVRPDDGADVSGGAVASPEQAADATRKPGPGAGRDPGADRAPVPGRRPELLPPGPPGQHGVQDGPRPQL